MSQSMIALIDCNNFFVSCERVFRPDLWGRPVGVLSNNDGCFVARSQELKDLGVPMGAPYFMHKALIKRAGVTLFSANFALYGEFSQRVAQVIAEQASSVEVYSVDESFVEVDTNDPLACQQWAMQLRQRIDTWLGIPVSIGVASTKTLAKLATSYAKTHPETGGVSVITSANLDQVLRDTPIGDVWGIGRQRTARLQARGISTAAEFAALDAKQVQSLYTLPSAQTQAELQGNRIFLVGQASSPQKSLSRGRTFGHAVRNYHELESAVANFVAAAAVRLRRKQLVAGGVRVFMRTSRHSQNTRAVDTVVRLGEATAGTGALITAGLTALEQLYDPDFAYQKIEITLVDLVPEEATQHHFFEHHAETIPALMKSVDSLKQRYGQRAVRHGSELLGTQRWHSQADRRSQNYLGSWAELARVKA